MLDSGCRTKAAVVALRTIPANQMRILSTPAATTQAAENLQQRRLSTPHRPLLRPSRESNTCRTNSPDLPRMGPELSCFVLPVVAGCANDE